MTPISSKDNWHDKNEVKKGDIGESIIKDFLEAHNYILYRPITNGAHKIDFFAHSSIEKKVICAEVKSKRRMATKAKTGVNVSALQHYSELYEKHNIPTYIFFIDDFERCVYGNWLHMLGAGEITGRNNYQAVTVWELSAMKFIRWLSEVEITELSKHTSENYDYSRVIKYWESNRKKGCK